MVQYRQTANPACGELVMDYGAVPGLDALTKLPGRRRRSKRGHRRVPGVKCEASVLLVLEVPQALPHAVELEDYIDDMELSRPHPVTMGLANNASAPLPPGLMATGRLVAMNKAEMKAFTKRKVRVARGAPVRVLRWCCGAGVLTPHACTFLLHVCRRRTRRTSERCWRSR